MSKIDLKEWLKQNRKKIDKNCEGCKRITEDEKCTTYYDPVAKWRNTNCPMATHITKDEKQKGGKVRVGQQKQKKKARRG